MEHQRVIIQFSLPWELFREIHPTISAPTLNLHDFENSEKIRYLAGREVPKFLYCDVRKIEFSVPLEVNSTKNGREAPDNAHEK